MNRFKGHNGHPRLPGGGVLLDPPRRPQGAQILTGVVFEETPDGNVKTRHEIGGPTIDAINDDTERRGIYAILGTPAAMQLIEEIIVAETQLLILCGILKHPPGQTIEPFEMPPDNLSIGEQSQPSDLKIDLGHLPDKLTVD